MTITRPTYTLPYWMAGKRALAVTRAAKRWWDTAEGYVRLPLTTFDVLSCELSFVDLLAYQRGIARYAGESEAFYRLRVHHALRNARAAGTPAGTRHIFDNLQLPYPRFAEWMPNRDWDVTRVTFSGRGYARLHAEIDFVLRFYWRTCRRFEVVQEVKAETHYGAGMFGSVRSVESATHVAQAVPFRPARSMVGFGVVGSVRSVESATHVAQAVPFRPARHTLPVSGFFSCRSRHVRSFSA
jgi:hypothetical protein